MMCAGCACCSNLSLSHTSTLAAPSSCAGVPECNRSGAAHPVDALDDGGLDAQLGSQGVG